VGAGDNLVGRSHECDFPPQALQLPIVSRPALEVEKMSPAEIDRAVGERLGSGESLYEVDERLLRELSPDVIITQDLCQVCAPSGNELSRAIRDLPKQPEVVWLTPQNIADIENNIRAVGKATGRLENAESIVRANRARIAAVKSAVAGAATRRVSFLEWIDPYFCAGHWVPEMIQLAGGDDPLGKLGADSERIDWDRIVAQRPEIILVSPCGYRLEEAVKLSRKIPPVPGAKVYAVDANAYFARPGPRYAEAIELLAHIFHPDLIEWKQEQIPFKRIA
jgi:iron complex transport system substrate-binding protein